MRNEFYPVVFRNRNGEVDIISKQTRHAALNLLRMMQNDPKIVKIAILEKGKYNYQETINYLTESRW